MTRSFKLLLTGAALAGSLVLMGTRAQDGRAAPLRAEALGGEAVFRAVFFGEGPAAALLPELREGRGARGESLDAAARLASEHQSLLARVGSEDPEFFDNFGEAVRSGNHLMISRALDDAALRLAEVKRTNDVPGANERHAMDAARGAVYIGPPVGEPSPCGPTQAMVLILCGHHTSRDVSPLKRDQVVQLLADRLSGR